MVPSCMEMHITIAFCMRFISEMYSIWCFRWYITNSEITTFCLPWKIACAKQRLSGSAKQIQYSGFNMDRLLMKTNDVTRHLVTVYSMNMITSVHGVFSILMAPFVRGIHWSPVDSPHKGLASNDELRFLCRKHEEAVEATEECQRFMTP